jgi:hypothetical protein
VFAVSLVFLLISLAPAGDGKKKPDDKKKKPLPPQLLIATVEFRDGSTLQYEFQPNHFVTVRSLSLDLVALKLENIRLLDVEAEVPKDRKVESLPVPHRVALHGLETIYGLVVSETLQARLVTTREKMAQPLELARVRRISFPIPPPALTVY